MFVPAKNENAFLFEGMSNDKNKSRGDGLLPAVSRRQFIRVGSALAALPFVARVGKAEASEGTAAQDEPAENIIQTCSTFDCGEV